MICTSMSILCARGGATWDFLEHQSMERTLLRGRWASTSSARMIRSLLTRCGGHHCSFEIGQMADFTGQPSLSNGFSVSGYAREET